MWVAAASTSALSVRPTCTAPTSLLCTISRDTSLSTTGNAMAAPASAAASRRRRERLARNGEAIRRKQRFYLAFGLRARSAARAGSPARQIRGPGRRLDGRAAQAVVVGDERQHAQCLLEAVVHDEPHLPQFLARRVGRRPGRADDHHRLAASRARFGDRDRALEIERHRHEKADAVVHGRIARTGCAWRRPRSRRPRARCVRRGRPDCAACGGSSIFSSSRRVSSASGASSRPKPGTVDGAAASFGRQQDESRPQPLAGGQECIANRFAKLRRAAVVETAELVERRVDPRGEPIGFGGRIRSGAVGGVERGHV